MKLVTLNIWGGHLYEPLLNFVETVNSPRPEIKNAIDVFCFQEVYHRADEKISTEDRQVRLNIFSDIQKKLPHHRGYFRPIVNQSYGICLFINKDIEVLSEGSAAVYLNPGYKGSGPTHSREIQWLQCIHGEKVYTLFNFHGLWNGKGKEDCMDRIEQSKKIRDLVCTFDGPKIICGDFNLRPDTESMKILEIGMHNLIRTYGVNSTRTSYYPKEERYADYILTSHGIMIHDFKVLPDEVSDHSPLYVEFV